MGGSAFVRCLAMARQSLVGSCICMLPGHGQARQSLEGSCICMLSGHGQAKSGGVLHLYLAWPWPSTVCRGSAFVCCLAMARQSLEGSCICILPGHGRAKSCGVLHLYVAWPWPGFYLLFLYFSLPWGTVNTAMCQCYRPFTSFSFTYRDQLTMGKSVTCGKQGVGNIS